MMAKDPESRPSADDILEMDILNEKNKVCFFLLVYFLRNAFQFQQWAGEKTW